MSDKDDLTYAPMFTLPLAYLPKFSAKDTLLMLGLDIESVIPLSTDVVSF